MAVYDWRPWVPDAGYFIYWNWLPDSFTNYWSYVNPEAQALGNEAITMAVGSPERQAKLRRFQEIVNGDIGLVPLFTQFDNIVMREHVQGYVYYPDTVPVLAKMQSGVGRRGIGSRLAVFRRELWSSSAMSHGGLCSSFRRCLVPVWSSSC